MCLPATMLNEQRGIPLPTFLAGEDSSFLLCQACVTKNRPGAEECAECSSELLRFVYVPNAANYKAQRAEQRKKRLEERQALLVRKAWTPNDTLYMNRCVVYEIAFSSPHPEIVGLEGACESSPAR